MNTLATPAPTLRNAFPVSIGGFDAAVCLLDRMYRDLCIDRTADAGEAEYASWEQSPLAAKAGDLEYGSWVRVAREGSRAAGEVEYASWARLPSRGDCAASVAAGELEYDSWLPRGRSARA